MQGGEAEDQVHACVGQQALVAAPALDSRVHGKGAAGVLYGQGVGRVSRVRKAGLGPWEHR